MKRTMSLAAATAILLLVSSTAVLAGPHHRRGAPDHAFQIRIGEFMPEGGGDLWDDVEDVFTLDISDFNDSVWGLSYVSAFSDNLEVGINADFFDSTVLSDYRDFVDEAGFPIFHDTRLEKMPLTVDIRLLPGGRYRARPGGRFVKKPVFYVGGGAGVTFWEYEEVGDFIDFFVDPPEVFPGRFKDSGTAFETHVLAGFELPLSPGFNLLVEGRKSWADDELRDDFDGFGKIELGGTSVYIGGSFRF